ncbi:uncharacterized protein UV8b_00636 [Ustilaginoidea virens]|uniref:Uncharacterized protein n=1 Tax=Ustilaginoidea virens TaxID=1159556 RepID=A0A063BTY1_USTVR|nr:uncharacterized protein UV8b_00636 [Ustilaginoidea virens]QUC16395.1 hypothetical protein UV8b_00636 [Ustilaginoidea virens]GAO13384.1 hypothetical protein UVI_02013930 [Ustilaginoidea virens]
MAVKLLLALLCLALTGTAAPSPSTDNATKTTPLTGVTHSVVAGLGGLRFDPDNVVAQVGDVVEWHFLPRNHSVAQSSFADPCRPLGSGSGSGSGSGFFPGFEFATEQGQARNVFQIVVRDMATIWYYCPQQAGDHCQNGMVGVVNQNFDNPGVSLSRYRERAALTGRSVIPPVSDVGKVIVNPNPNGGF